MRVHLAWVVSWVLGCAAAAAAGEIYRYRDAQGRTHFTDSYYEVPEPYRDRVEEIGGEVEESGSVSVIPGFGEKKPAADARDSGKRDGKKSRGPGGSWLARVLEGARARIPGGAGASSGFVVFVVLLVLVVSLAIAGGLLMAACNIVGERPLVLGQAMLIVFLQSLCGALASGALNLTLALAGQPGPTLAALALATGFATGLGTQVAVLKGMHCETWWGALKVTFALAVQGLLLAAPLLWLAAR